MILCACCSPFSFWSRFSFWLIIDFYLTHYYPLFILAYIDNSLEVVIMDFLGHFLHYFIRLFILPLTQLDFLHFIQIDKQNKQNALFFSTLVKNDLDSLNICKYLVEIDAKISQYDKYGQIPFFPNVTFIFYLRIEYSIYFSFILSI